MHLTTSKLCAGHVEQRIKGAKRCRVECKSGGLRRSGPGLPSTTFPTSPKSDPPHHRTTYAREVYCICLAVKALHLNEEFYLCSGALKHSPVPLSAPTLSLSPAPITMVRIETSCSQKKLLYFISIHLLIRLAVFLCVFLCDSHKVKLDLQANSDCLRLL